MSFPSSTKEAIFFHPDTLAMCVNCDKEGLETQDDSELTG
jgi:hypothetical protein